MHSIVISALLIALNFSILAHKPAQCHQANLSQARQGTSAAGRKCVPIFSFVPKQTQSANNAPATSVTHTPPAALTLSPSSQHDGVNHSQQSSSSSSSSSGQTNNVPAAPTIAGRPLTFAIGDIDLPINLASGSMQSAMRMLASLDEHLSGDSEGGEDDEGELRDGNNNRGQQASNVVRFRENKLHIEGLNLTMLQVHLHRQNEPKFALGVKIRNTTLTGRFTYKGPASLLSSSKLAGFYRMSIEDILLVASANLAKLTKSTRTVLPQALQYGAGDDNSFVAGGVGDTNNGNDLRLVANEFKLNITNLGYISIDISDTKPPAALGAGLTPSPPSNYLLRMLQRVLQKTVKRTYYSFEEYIRRTLEEEARQFVDCELTRFTPFLNEAAAVAGDAGAISGGQNEVVDLAHLISKELASAQLDHVALPPFDYQRSLFGTNASILFDNGQLAGLHHLRLTGDTRVKLQDEHLLVNASIGWFDLRSQYNWSLSLGVHSNSGGGEGDGGSSGSTGNSGRATPLTKGLVAFTIKRIDFDAVISRGPAHGDSPLENNSQANLIVDELTIRHLESPRMELSGLPGMNRITRSLVNFFMSRLKQRISNSLQPVLRQQLEKSLNKLPWLSGNGYVL